jgi:hypothetical protein
MGTLAVAEVAIHEALRRRRQQTAEELRQELEELRARERAEAEAAARRQPAESRQAWRYRTRALRASPLKG